MPLANSLRAGIELGDAAIGAAKGVNTRTELSNASRQMSVGSSAFKTIGAQLAKMANRGVVPESEVGTILAQIQSLGADESQAVSCGWWLGQARGTCKHKIKEVTGTDLASCIDQATAHANVLVANKKTNWRVGDVTHRFGTLRTAMQAMKLAAMPNGVALVTTLGSQFASTLK